MLTYGMPLMFLAFCLYGMWLFVHGRLVAGLLHGAAAWMVMTLGDYVQSTMYPSYALRVESLYEVVRYGDILRGGDPDLYGIIPYGSLPVHTQIIDGQPVLARVQESFWEQLTLGQTIYGSAMILLVALAIAVHFSPSVARFVQRSAY